MEARAYAKYIRIAPRKVKIVCDLIRGKDAQMAEAILKNTRKSASEYMIKLLDSARANAENNHEMNADNLYVAEVFAAPGPVAKRLHARARGRAFRILKRSSHITMVLREKE